MFYKRSRGLSKGSGIYQNPLVERYASAAMLKIFSSDEKFSTWRRLWLALAKAEQALGLDISDGQIAELAANIDNIDYELAAKYEKKLRHDVMAHVHTLGDICPLARPIIHLGATSAYVGDNTDIIVMKKALVLVREKLAALVIKMSNLAEKYRNLPTLGFTHMQPAQLTTVGKRIALWTYDLAMDLENLEEFENRLKLRGAKGTTGTQASFMELFNGDEEKVKKLDLLVAEQLGFNSTYAVVGQTTSRKIDADCVNRLALLADSLHKMTNDLRLLQSLKEVEEPFESTQIGSSAMAYKRNPMRSERIASLSKYVISLSSSPHLVAATQWFERTLDDSANKRLTIPEAFLAIDASLEIAINVFSELKVYEKVIRAHIVRELPFMITENIIMNAVKKGRDRQELHERIRVHSMVAAKRVKEDGLDNNLIELIASDDYFGISKGELDQMMNPDLYTGRAGNQVTDFIREIIEPIRARYGKIEIEKYEMKV